MPSTRSPRNFTAHGRPRGRASSAAPPCEKLKDWAAGLRHRVAAEEWPAAADIIATRKDDLLADSAPLLKQALEKLPPDIFYRDLRLVHIKAETLARLDDFAGAVRTYKEMISQRVGASPPASVTRYQQMANAFVEKKKYPQALNFLRGAFTRLEKGDVSFSTDRGEALRERPEPRQAAAGAQN